jgi:hypothetical protein
MTQPTIVFSPLQAGLPAAGGGLEVLVRIQAPDRPADLAAAHLPKCLPLFVDCSNTMNGQPLQEALRCVTHIASHLTPQDALALVVYDDKVDTLLPLQPMRSADAVAKAVAGVQAGGMPELRCRPGDLAVVIRARNPVNIGRIVRVLQLDQGSGILTYPKDTPTWLTVSEHSMTWSVKDKRVRRKRGPIPDAQLQPIRGLPPGHDMTESLSDFPGVVQSTAD